MEDGRPAPGYRRVVAEPLIQVGHRAGSFRDIGAVTKSRFYGAAGSRRSGWAGWRSSSLDAQQVMSFTGRECEALHPVVSLDPDRT